MRRVWNGCVFRRRHDFHHTNYHQSHLTRDLSLCESLSLFYAFPMQYIIGKSPQQQTEKTVVQIKRLNLDRVKLKTRRQEAQHRMEYLCLHPL